MIFGGKRFEYIPEDNVVLTQDELNDENHFTQRFGYDLGSKETAEKIYLQAKAIVDATKHNRNFKIDDENS